MIFVDSFSHYVTAQIGRKWTTAGSTCTIVVGGGRNGQSALHFNGSSGNELRKVVAAVSEMITGFAWKLEKYAATRSPIVMFETGGAAQIILNLLNDGTFSVTSGGNTYGPTTDAISLGTWYYLEFKSTFAVSTGNFTFRVNGVTWLTRTNVFTAAVTTSATANSVHFANTGFAEIDSFTIADFYLANGSGGTVTDFLGDVQIAPLHTDSNGDIIQWTPFTGGSTVNNWANVDEQLADDDLSYNLSSTANTTELYGLQPLSGSPISIFGIQWNAQLRKNDVSTYLLNRVISTTGGPYFGTTVYSPGTVYANFNEVIEVSPHTGLNWTQVEINALQAGIRLSTVI